jgi:uncharacterized protein YodC (DUF2158 family)
MKRRFKKGERVRNCRDGRVMEVVNYIKDNHKYLVECAWFDLEKKEMRMHTIAQEILLKAS